ncbi:hypothetical protein ACXYRP_03695 [Mycoplasma sp. 5912]
MVPPRRPTLYLTKWLHIDDIQSDVKGIIDKDIKIHSYALVKQEEKVLSLSVGTGELSPKSITNNQQILDKEYDTLDKVTKKFNSFYDYFFKATTTKEQGLELISILKDNVNTFRKDQNVMNAIQWSSDSAKKEKLNKLIKKLFANIKLKNHILYSEIEEKPQLKEKVIDYFFFSLSNYDSSKNQSS